MARIPVYTCLFLTFHAVQNNILARVLGTAQAQFTDQQMYFRINTHAHSFGNHQHGGRNIFRVSFNK